MRQGARVIVLAIACCSIAVPPLASSSHRDARGQGAATSISIEPSGSRTSASGVVQSLVIRAKPGFANEFEVFVDGGPPAELVIRSPQGLARPGGECTPPPPDDPSDPTTEVRCPLGYIDLIAGNLGDRDDTFTAARNVKVPIGGISDGQARRLYGGPGHDRVVGGAAGDSVGGDGGGDTLVGARGRDALYGGKGKDGLSGSRGADALYGGGGGDRLNGGSGRDLCNGGAGRDRAKLCAFTRRVP
jgi:hypothetical protein